MNFKLIIKKRTIKKLNLLAWVEAKKFACQRSERKNIWNKRIYLKINSKYTKSGKILDVGELLVIAKKK